MNFLQSRLKHRSRQPHHLVHSLLFSLSFHEAAHAWTSEKFGDDTGRIQGRITLNPMAHIDLFGTMLFPLVSVYPGFRCSDGRNRSRPTR